MTIRIFGCGAMGGAIGHALAEHGKSITVYDKHKNRAQELAEALSAHLCSTPLEGTSEDEILLLAVKPQDLESVAKDLEDFRGKLIVSILTGTTLAQLKECFPDTPVLRMVPNLAVRYGDGIVALAENPDLALLQHEIEQTFAPLGLLRWFPESRCNAMTALAGSGTAFVFSLIDSMVDAAIEMGFTAHEAYELIKQMVGGALTTLYESNELPAQLKWQVASPNGTTIAGLRVFEAKGVRSGLIETFLAAYVRAQELSQ